MLAFCLRLVVLMLVTIFVLTLPPGVAAQEREKCVEDRAIAEKRYLEGRFDEAVTLLQQCLGREDLLADEAVQVYRLMSLAHLNKGDREQARQVLRDLLLHAPAYKADPVQDPPSYTTMVEEVRVALAAQALPEVALEAPVEEEAVPMQEVAADEEPPADLPQRQPAQRLTDERVVPPLTVGPQPTKRGVMRTPQSWLLATGGALVVAAAVALVFGGRADSSPAPPR